jgi:hypothetical protein
LVKASRLFHFLGRSRAAWFISRARRTRTIKRCSFDARSRRRIQAALPWENRKACCA